MQLQERVQYFEAALKWGSTNAGMEWTTGMACKVQILSCFFFAIYTLSNRVSMASRYCYDNVRKNCMEGPCVRIGPGVNKHCHTCTPDYCRSGHFQRLSHRPSHSIFRDYAGILYCHTAPVSPNSCVLSSVCTYDVGGTIRGPLPRTGGTSKPN